MAIETCTESATMSIFLPRELFEPLAASQAPVIPSQPVAKPAARPVHWPFMAEGRRAATRFDSGEAVAADLLQNLQPDAEPAFGERRRAVRPEHLRGVDLYIA